MEGQAPYIELPYRPRAYQARLHRELETHRFCVIVMHRRAGKTVMVVNHMLKAAWLCRKPHALFAYIAPFRNQAKSIAWGMLKHFSAPIPGISVNEGELSIWLPNGAGIRIFGADNADALRGNRFDGVVMDEVADMRPDVWQEVVRPALSDRRGWAVFIGTPKGENLFHDLYKLGVKNGAQENSEWFSAMLRVDETGAIPDGEVASLRAEMSSNSFRQEYLCDFSASSDDILITIDDVAQAEGRKPEYETMASWPLIVGVDVARYGEDATVFFPRRGRVAYQPEVLRKRSNTDVAHRLMAYIAERKPAYVCIDQGQGTGVIDLVRDLTASQPVRIIEVPFGSKAGQEGRFVNRRAEMWVGIRDWLRSGGYLPEVPGLAAELTGPTYSYDASGRIKLEPKEDIKKRLDRSTDLADALALTFAVPAGPDRDSVMPSLDERYGVKAARKTRDWLTGEDSPGYDFFAEFEGRGDDDGFNPFA